MKVLFFSPHAFIDVHSVPEALVAASLQEDQCEVVTVGCSGAYHRFCVAMSAGRLVDSSPEPEKAKICKICIARKQAIRDHFDLRGCDLEAFFEEGDVALVARLLADVDRHNWADFGYAGIPVGRYASYEFLLNHKINKLVLSEAQWLLFRSHLEDALQTALAGQRLLQTEKPDVVATYNSQYAVHHIICALAEQRGIPHYTLHAGSHHVYRLSQMTIFKGLRAQKLINRSATWQWFSEQPLSRARILRVTEHVSELLRAESPWVYSVKSTQRDSEELRTFFGIRSEQKVLLVTMASADERFAATLVDAMPPYEEPFFKTQIEWIHRLISWVAERPAYFLIIRVHPREFPNKREKVLSAQAQELSSYFQDLPDNARVNWPEEKVSLHDLIKITSLGLNATSTAGLELLLFGVPVLIYDQPQLFAYPRELNWCANSPTDYFAKIELAVAQGWRLDYAIAAYRWLAYRSEVLSIDIADGYRAPPFWLRAVNEILRRFGRAIPLPGLAYWRRGRLRQADKLVMAIREGLESHLDSLAFRVPPPGQLSVAAERALILACVRRFARRLGRDRAFEQKLSALSV